MADDPITLADLAGMGVDRLTGVGPKKLDGLAKLGIESLLDLLMHYPRRYLDRTNQARVADLRPGDEAMVLATVRSISSRRVRGGRAMVTGEIADDSGRLKISFFNQGWRERQLPVGTEAVFYGKVEDFRGVRQMTNPVVDLIGTRTGKIIPVYPQSEKSGLSTWDLGDMAAQALRRCERRGIAEPLPRVVLEQFDFVSRQDALVGIHTPTSMGQASAARKRLVFDELLRIQLALVLRKRAIELTSVGIIHDSGSELIGRYFDRLAFPLTGAQERVIGEITRRSLPGRSRCTDSCRATWVPARPSSRSPRCSRRCRVDTRRR